jgi:hypothetical protein
VLPHFIDQMRGGRLVKIGPRQLEFPPNSPVVDSPAS